MVADVFQPVATGAPAPVISSRDDHVVKKQHVVDEIVPLQTNKFYANFFLGNQDMPVWTHPYSLAWAKGRGDSWGMSISHTERQQFAFGPDANQPQYIISPIGIQYIVLSAKELGSNTVLTVEDLQAFSVYANFAASAGSRTLMSVPCVQGMGYVTAVYNDATPILNSGVFFRSLEYIEPTLYSNTFKYAIQLEDNSRWILYATPSGSSGVPPFILADSTTITGPSNFFGTLQITKIPAGNAGEQVFDASAGAYATRTTISGSVDGNTGNYTLAWTKGGIQNRTLLMYALPHHVESFNQESSNALTDIQLASTSKGYARGVVADKITMNEFDLPDTIGFAPWVKTSEVGGTALEHIQISDAALALINNVGASELSQDFISQTSLDSMYYSGKGLAKFAGILYTMQTIGNNSNLAAAGLKKLKDAFSVFVNNTQPEPLVYDTVWRGVVSSATYRWGDVGLDFGNTLYNDHHFHYGYFVWTAAVIGYLDPKWLDEGTNKVWINTLVRDYANPVKDEYFPFSRSFDWFHGHSWAKGLFESSDGKDQESTSEDTFSTYALKMWGRTIGDRNMEARSSLQLAIQARSINNYFLLASDNKNQPQQFLHNKVTGILFENKVDHTTYFGTNVEYIQGIHMIPLNPSSAYSRPKKFVQEEWDTYFSNGRVDRIAGGWKGILYANLALIDPQTSYNFFAASDFDWRWLDGGASRTWYLAYSAALLGAGGGNTGSGSYASANSTTSWEYGTMHQETVIVDEYAGEEEKGHGVVYGQGVHTKGRRHGVLG